uniref:RING-type domain-containing protein n=1 Tax=Globisporangium ultimum (strain ATCC 200006 / CBS 805.95 / DAOM BR144) TaxID=431595 RepID=K3WFT7_GLOUD
MFAAGFGDAYLEMLEYVAGIMGGEFRTELTGSELKNAFYSISTSLSSRVGLALSKPSHECLCAICQRDLAPEDLVQLKLCHHEMHTKCWRQLTVQLSDGAKSLCPMCCKVAS